MRDCPDPARAPAHIRAHGRALRLPALALMLALGATAAWAQTAAVPDAAVPPTPVTAAGPDAAASGTPLAASAERGATLPPPGFVAPAEPRTDDTNGQRAKSQPGNNAPFWRAVRESGVNKGISSLPGAEQGVLIQEFVQYPGSRLTNAGEAWRQVRNNWIIPYGGALFLIVLLALALFYWRMGKMGGHLPDVGGRKIQRFTFFEQAAHFSVAASFVVLEISGLVMAFGKHLLLPLIGGPLFGWLTYALKTAHNLVGPLFAVALVIFIFTYLRDNLPRLHDLKWISRPQGMLTGHEEPSGKFNAGEKMIFWGGVIFMGITVATSGIVLDKLVPGMSYVRGDMQIAQMVHSLSSMVMMAMFLIHMYMGTIGLDGAYKAMHTGYVDEAWAKEHHGLWYDDIKAGRIPAQRTPAAAPPVGRASPQA
jgi:formate dehydrogenase subunit gamma